MKYIAINKEDAKAISEQGIKFSGKIEGYLATSPQLIKQQSDSEDYPLLISGCDLVVINKKGEEVLIGFNGLQSQYMDDYMTSVPSVFSLPLANEQVTLVSNGIIKFNIEVTNNIWMVILNNYKKIVERRLNVELGIDNFDLLTKEPVIKYYGDDYYERAPFIKPLVIRHRFVIDQDNLGILNDIFNRRNYLFDVAAFESRELGKVDLSRLSREDIEEIGNYFNPVTIEEVVLWLLTQPY